MKTVSPESVLDFEKKLIEIGGVFHVEDDRSIKNVQTNQIVTITSGKKNVPIVFFYEGIPTGEYELLNPFKENLGVNRAREWFYGSLNTLVSLMLKALMDKLIRDALEKKDDNYNQFPLMSRITDKVDATMIDELDKIRSLDLLSIYYNKKTKTAEAQTCLYSEEYHKEHSKFRKKSWEVFQILFENFLGTKEVTDDYAYQANIISIPETDAKLHVIIGLIKSLDPYTKDILGTDLHSQDLEQYLDQLEGFAHIYAWSSQLSAEPEKVSSVPPWNQNTPAGYNQQPQLVPTGAYGTPAPTQLIPTSSIDQNGMVHVGSFGYGMGGAFGSPMQSAASGPLGLPSYQVGYSV